MLAGDLKTIPDKFLNQSLLPVREAWTGSTEAAFSKIGRIRALESGNSGFETRLCQLLTESQSLHLRNGIMTSTLLGCCEHHIVNVQCLEQSGPGKYGSEAAASVLLQIQDLVLLCELWPPVLTEL